MSWKHEKLGNHFNVIRNGASIKQEDGKNGVPITRIETIANGFIDLNKVGFADIESDHFSDYYLQNDDILMSHINSWTHLGKSAIVNNLTEKVIHGMNLLLLRANPKTLFPQYAKYYFETKSFKSQLHKISNQSVNQSSFAVTKLKELFIPLPSLATQQKIAVILDKADDLRRKDKQLLSKYDELLQSIFYQMFGDPVKNEKEWEKIKLESICDVGSGKRVFVDELVKNGIPFYRGTEIGALSFGQKIIPSLFINEEHYERLKNETGVPQIGDLLMPSICPDGRIFEVADSNPFYFKDGRVLWVKVKQNHINSRYLKIFLKEIFRTSYSKIASGTTFSELKIFELKKIQIALPPITLQNEFALIVQNIQIQMNHIYTQAQQSEFLFQSLLQKAFKGELIK